MTKVEMGKVNGRAQGKFYRLRDAFDFGKYKGEIIQNVLVKDPSYVAWCMENVQYFKFRPEDEDIISIALEGEPVSGKPVRTSSKKAYRGREDTYDRFQERDRGRFGDNESSDRRAFRDQAHDKAPWED